MMLTELQGRSMAQAPTRRLSQPIEADHPIMSRSNSSHSIPEQRLRPKSRGSTTSLQSVGVGNAFQPAQHRRDNSIAADQNGMYMQANPSTATTFTTQRPEEPIMYHAQHHPQMAHLQSAVQPMLDHNMMHISPHEARPISQQGFHDNLPYAMPYQQSMAPYHMQPHLQHVRHPSEQYEGSPAPEDSSNENGGVKRKKGSASTVANDQELRRLLQQYQGKTLKDVASEVQRNEGTGGKSEKAKQVFAMLWLEQNCARSSHSVRRDKVFARYTSRCGNERVPTLNPASFGKLVRIIFPNVQTRRLGVRGESKYHYVDLSLVADDEQLDSATFERPGTSGSLTATHVDTSAVMHKPAVGQPSARSQSAGPIDDGMETADFPIPGTGLVSPTAPKPVERTRAQHVDKMDCQHLNTPTIRIPTAHMSNDLVAKLPALRQNLSGTMAAYLAMPSEDSLSQATPSSQDTPIELPDIHQYLADTQHDTHIAQLLHDLYRSYCIDVIDAFRKCKEKSFFNHHSAFNGKMTVPVSKLFTMECVAPWIQECDRRMYQQIVRFLAPLVQQEVPVPVWAVFERISKKLVGHLVSTFDEKCPVHVVVAKIVPAARFTTLLKKLKGANAAALQVSRLLENADQRTQMWLDALVLLNPDTVIEDSSPPPESLHHIKGMLKSDLRNLIAPLDDVLVQAAEVDNDSTYADMLTDPTHHPGLLSPLEESTGMLQKWIQWLERLPTAFDGHHPQCMLDWHSRFWRSILGLIGEGTAPSYQGWWYLESFTTHMLGYMTQMEGLLLSGAEQQALDAIEQSKKAQYESIRQASLKRKHDEANIDGGHTTGRRIPLPPPPPSALKISTIATPPRRDVGGAEEADAVMSELRRGGPLELPTYRTGFSSPLKQIGGAQTTLPTTSVDDSGIELLDEPHGPDTLETEKEAKKFNKRDWFLSSDPIDPGVANVGVVA